MPIALFGISIRQANDRNTYIRVLPSTQNKSQQIGTGEMNLTNKTIKPMPMKAPATDPVRMLVVVEGTNDVEFLRRISMLLHSQDQSLPHLAEMEQRGELIFIPCGGGDVRAWTHRLAPLNKHEFYLIDHELPPETDYRREAARTINARDNCRAVLTCKRSIENYLHRQAIRLAGEVDIEFTNFDSVAELTAKYVYHRSLGGVPWELLPRRARRRFTNRAKRWLNTRAVAEMTMSMLGESDPAGEIISWLQQMRDLIEPG